MKIKHISHPLAIKSLAGDGLFMGYASVFGKCDSQKEIVAPGAFKKSLSRLREMGQTPAMLWMHDPTQPIGMWCAMSEDENGLVVQGRLALSTQKGREAYELLKMKALTGMSIGYRVVSSKIDNRRKARILTEVDLFEISLVTFPANDAARVSDVKAPKKTINRKKKTVSKTSSNGKMNVDKAATKKVVVRLHKAAKKLTEHKTNK